MNATDIINSGLRRFGEGTATSHFSSAMLLSFVNEAQREFMLQTKLWYGTFQTVGKTGIRTYSLPTAMFEPVEVHMYQWYSTNSLRGWSVLGRLSTRDLVQVSDSPDGGGSWMSKSLTRSVPYGWYVAEGINVIGLYPYSTAPSFVGTMMVYGYKTPADLTATAIPIFQPQFHAVLVEGLLMRMAEEDSDNARNKLVYDRALAKYQKYVEIAAGLPKPPYHFPPGDNR